VCGHACIYLRMHVCMYVCMCECVYTHTHIYINFEYLLDVTPWCFRAGNRASEPDFGRLLVGKIRRGGWGHPQGGEGGVNICLYIYIYVHVYVYVCMHVCVYTYVCMFECRYVCMCEYACMYV
jgi:hypothetical protein